MRVVHLCKIFSQISETFIYDYVSELERQGVDLSVLAYRRANPEKRPFDDVTVVPRPSDWHPLRVGYRVLEWLGLRENHTSYWTLHRSRLRPEIERINPDVIHAHFGPRGAMIAPLAERMGIPLVVTFYGVDISRLPKQQRWRDAYEHIWRTASAITVLSEDMKQQALRWGAPSDRIRVVHLARRLEEFPYRPPTTPLSEFVSVGRLTEKKGHFDAIRAVQQVVESGEDIRLQIVGGGALHDELAQYIRAHDLQSHVELLGTRPNEEVATLLEEADAFLLCSKTAPNGDREGTPTVLVEAQAVGLPCVSTRHAGIPEMIPEANHSLLANEGDVDDIAERIRSLRACSQEEVRRIAEAGRAKIEESFYLPGEVQKLREVYAQVAGARAAPPDP